MSFNLCFAVLLNCCNLICGILLIINNILCNVIYVDMKYSLMFFMLFFV